MAKKITKRPRIRRIDFELELHRLEERCDAIEQSMFWLSKPLTEMFARRIVEGLFTHGSGRVADRLVHQSASGHYGGGWSLQPAVDHVVRIIEKYFAESIEAGKKINRRGRGGAE